MDIVRVPDKLAAFRADFPAREFGIEQWAVEDVCGEVPRVWGFCKITDLKNHRVLAQACGTRALRAPVPGAQGVRDTRDPERAMTQALGRALGLLGYASGESIEGDTDEPDETGVRLAVVPNDSPPQPPVPPAPPKKAAKAAIEEARKTLAGETDVDLVDTAQLKDRLNACTPEERGKVRAGLLQAGFPTDIPEMLEREKFDYLWDAVEEELVKIGAIG